MLEYRVSEFRHRSGVFSLNIHDQFLVACLYLNNLFFHPAWSMRAQCYLEARKRQDAPHFSQVHQPPACSYMMPHCNERGCIMNVPAVPPRTRPGAISILFLLGSSWTFLIVFLGRIATR